MCNVDICLLMGGGYFEGKINICIFENCLNEYFIKVLVFFFRKRIIIKFVLLRLKI